MRVNFVVFAVFLVWSLVNILFLTRIKFSESQLENQLNELTLHYTQELKEYETKQTTKCNLYSMVNNRKMQRKRTDYSSFRVFGGSHKNVTNRLLWHFKNVCYNAKNNRFEFYKNPNKLFDEPVLFNNGTHYKFPPLQYGRLLETDHFVNMDILEKMSPPIDKFWSPKVAVWLKDVYPGNWGHMMMDHMYPAYHSTNLLQIFDPEELSIVLPDKKDGFSFAKWLNNYGILTGDGPRDFIKIKKRRLTCFHNLVIGAHNYAFFYGVYDDEFEGRGWSYTKFRDFLRYKIAGLTPDDVPKEQRILIVYKDGNDWAQGRRNFANVEEMKNALKTAFSTIPVDSTTLFHMSPEEQVRFLSNYTVVIAPAGSVSMISLLFADGTVGIFPDYWDLDTNSSRGLEQYLYQNYPWITNYQYSLGSANEVISRDMSKPLPGYKNSEGSFQAFNLKYYGSPKIDTKRLVKLVYSALYKVYEERGDEFEFPSKAAEEFVKGHLPGK